MTINLSPAAQSVLDVYWRNVGMPPALAKELGFTNTPLVAALRAAADQVLEDWNEETYDKLLAIATELELAS